MGKQTKEWVCNECEKDYYCRRDAEDCSCDLNQEKLSLGWILFWLIIIPPIGVIWLFIEVLSGNTFYKKLK